MATFTSTACQTFNGGGSFINPPKYIENGVVARSAVYTFTAAQSAGDILQMVPIPKGAHILDVAVQFPGQSAAGISATYAVGDGTTAGRFLVSTSAFTVTHATLGLGYSYSAEDTIDLSFSSVTSATAGGTVRLTVLYAMDQAPDGNS